MTAMSGETLVDGTATTNTELFVALIATPFFGFVFAAIVVGTVGTLAVALLSRGRS